MGDFFAALGEYLERYKIEAILISLASIISVVAIIIYIINNRPTEGVFIPKISKTVGSVSRSKKILVDISGAVEKPGVYEVTPGARIKDVLVSANGLASEADRGYFLRNYNLARIVNDQEKIYIPAAWEIYSGLFRENQRTLDYTQPAQLNLSETTTSESQPDESIQDKISLNQAGVEDLDQLPGIGQVTAGKIIKNRPYRAIEDLINKKVLNKNIFDNIKNLVSL